MQLQSLEWGAYHQQSFQGMHFQVWPFRHCLDFLIFIRNKRKEIMIIKKKNLPHIFSKICSSSVDRKQFHLHQNSTPPPRFFTSTPTPPPPPPPPPPLIFTVRAHHRATQTPPRGVCGAPFDISSSREEEWTEGRVAVRKKKKKKHRQADINDRRLDVLQDLPASYRSYPSVRLPPEQLKPAVRRPLSSADVNVIN